MLSHTAEQPPKPKRPCYRTTIEKRGETSLSVYVCFISTTTCIYDLGVTHYHPFGEGETGEGGRGPTFQ